MRSRMALFPGGAAGAGLLLLRLAVALWTLELTARFAQAANLSLFVASAVAIGLAAGVQTRALAIFGALGFLIGAMTAATLLCPAAIYALGAAALALTGPGA